MDINKIKQIISEPLIPDTAKRTLIINVIASDREAIVDVLRILDSERKKKDELLTDMNLELSRAHIYIEERPETKSEKKDSFNKGFIMDEISKFYIKYKDVVSHCFNRFN